MQNNKKFCQFVLACTIISSLFGSTVSSTAKQDIDDIKRVEFSVQKCQISVMELQELLLHGFSTLTPNSIIESNTTIFTTTSSTTNETSVTPVANITFSSTTNETSVTPTTNTTINSSTTNETSVTPTTNTTINSSTTDELTTGNPTSTSSTTNDMPGPKLESIIDAKSSYASLEANARVMTTISWEQNVINVLDDMKQILTEIDSDPTNVDNAKELDNRNTIMDSLVSYGYDNTEVVNNSDVRNLSLEAVETQLKSRQTFENLEDAKADAEDKKHKTTVIASSVSAVIIVLIIVVGLFYFKPHKYMLKRRRSSITSLPEANNINLGLDNVNFTTENEYPREEKRIRETRPSDDPYLDPQIRLPSSQPENSRQDDPNRFKVSGHKTNEIESSPLARFEQYPPASSSKTPNPSRVHQGLPRLSTQNLRPVSQRR